MTPRTALLLLALAGSVGCTRYNSRGQAPQTRLPPPAGVVPPPAGGASPRSPLTMPGPTAPPPAATYPDTGSPVPPQPPGGSTAGVLPPTPAAPPAVAANPPARRSPPALPSPYAQPPAQSPPATQPVAAASTNDVRRVLNTAAARWQSIPSYDALLTRREFIKDKPPTAEQVRVQFRKEPFAIYMTTVSAAGKGREVLYAKGQFDDKIHVKLGEGDHWFMKAGFVAPPMSPDSKDVTDRSRYSIRDAGFGNSIARLGAALQKAESGQTRPDSVRYVGPSRRPEYQIPLERIDQVVPPGGEPLMPAGGTRSWFFDAQPDSPSYGMPVLMFAADPNGKELEYYCHTGVSVPSTATAADFTPERLSRKK